jgi:hypothetical protein
MTTETTLSPFLREPQLLGQTVVVIGGSSGIGLETARRARAEGAHVVLTGRNPERLQHAALELGALRSAAFDVTDFGSSPAILRRAVDAGRPRDDHRRRAVLRAPDGYRLRGGATDRRPTPLAAAPRRAQCGRQGATWRNAAVHERYRRPPPSRRDGAERGTHRRSPRARRPSHDEHRPHGRNLRYRRRAAAGGGLRAHRKEP